MTSKESRKRKRELINCREETNTNCFTNSAFTSTPKRLIPRRKLKLVEVNGNPFRFDVISVTDKAKKSKKQKHLESVEIPENPFEIVRKPPKKKRRDCEITNACFENPALNLELPEKQLNPFEVHREIPTTVPKTHCFINEALNIRGKDAPMHNPFEIHRTKTITPSNYASGVDNLGAEKTAPTQLKIGLPFKPTTDYRIDFGNMPLSEQTPRKLPPGNLIFSPVRSLRLPEFAKSMYPPTPSIREFMCPPLLPLGTSKEKTVFSPVRSLGIINEESSVDIGKELDRYQLELENSINEAKLSKNCGKEQVKKSRALALELESQKILAKRAKLWEIINDVVGNSSEDETEPSRDKADVFHSVDNKDIQEPGVKEFHSSDVKYASESEEEYLDTPVPFVRAYCPPDIVVPKNKQSLNSIKSQKSTDSSDKNSGGIKNVIRRSIRKLVHPNHENKQKKARDDHDQIALEPIKEHNIISNIRNSLRRKPVQHVVLNEPIIKADMSIVDVSERTMKLKATNAQTDFVKIEELTNEKKHSMRQSIRHSTREVRQQLMKTVFHKSQEQYAFSK